MATQLEISQRAYSKLENGETKLKWEHITTIAKVLDIVPNELITFDDSLIFS